MSQTELKLTYDRSYFGISCHGNIRSVYRLKTVKTGYYVNSNLSLISLFLISGCGGSSGTDSTQSVPFIGLIGTYKPLEPNFVEPVGQDQYFHQLKPALISPYWVDALIMDKADQELSLILPEDENELKFSFPELRPSYLHSAISGWGTASDLMKEASREIFDNINKILDVVITETSDPSFSNVIAISKSTQTTTSGLSYFPNSSFLIGSDVFIDEDFTGPEFISRTYTNLEYEILLHEIGHALGLKHPFEADRNNKSILSIIEDNSKWTAMTYTLESIETFSGEFRPLDLLALARLYGVNSEYNKEDNVYKFSADEFTFIIDGAGTDTISAQGSVEDVYLDLRPASHSYVGEMAEHITKSNQLTISHHSKIENVFTGDGNDYVIANEQNNIIVTGSGNDQIFLGEGSDIVDPGIGDDIIDFSESSQAKDMIIIDTIKGGIDTVYGFSQGRDGDIIYLKNLSDNIYDLLPVISIDDVPIGYISTHIIRIVGEDLDSDESIKNAFSDGGRASKLEIIDDSNLIVLAAESQETGSDQHLYCITIKDNNLAVDKLALFLGDYLDIDTWVQDNFSINENLIA